MSKQQLVNAESKRLLPLGSPVRAMFEIGLRLKAEHGADNVFDFSLGNPGLEPPAVFNRELTEAVEHPTPLMHGYPPNKGMPAFVEACARRAHQLHPNSPFPPTPDMMVVTNGAAGAINVFLRAVCTPGEEVLVLSPYFLEYRFYANNVGCSMKVVPARPDSGFEPDLAALEAAITEKTRVVILNSPNNPSGRIMPQATVDALGAVLKAASERFGRPIWILADEPYVRITYDGAKVADVFACPSPYVAVATSFSKDFSLPGERIGYVAVSPKAKALTPEGAKELVDSMCFWQRVLGFVNAPVLFQRVLTKCWDACNDVSWYDERRKLICDGLRKAGLQLDQPQGAFYAFPRIPEECKDDQEFVSALAERCVLCVAGSAFGEPRYVRFSYAVQKLETITRANEIIAEVVKQIKTRGKK